MAKRCLVDHSVAHSPISEVRAFRAAGVCVFAASAFADAAQKMAADWALLSVSEVLIGTA